MKILVIQNGWSGQGISGGDKHLLEVSSYWKASEDITFLLPRSGIEFLTKYFNESIHGLNIITVPEVTSFPRLSNLPILLFSYFQRTLSSTILLIVSSKFNIIVSSSHFYYDVLPAVMCKLVKGSKVAVYVYHLVSKQSRKPSLRNSISVRLEDVSLKLIKRYADVIFTDNPQTKEELKDYGIEHSKIAITRVGINRPEFVLDIAKKYDLCFIGRLVKNKGVYDVLEALSLLKNSEQQISLVFIGMGDEETGLKKRAEELGLVSNVSFQGSVSEKEKILIIQESRVFVSPSLEEGWGISLAEAMSYGLPTVVYDLPVLREIFKGGPIFVEVGNVEGLVLQITNLLTNESLYNLKSEEGKICVRNYFLDSIALEELNIIKKYAAADK